MAETQLHEAKPRIQELFERGQQAFRRGNLDYAVDLFFRCVELEPGLLQARKMLRTAEVKKIKRKKITTLTHTISTLKGGPGFVRAMTLLKSGKGREALLEAERLMMLDPLNTKFVKVFIQAADAADLPEAAIQTLEIARDHFPDDLWILNGLGALYQRVGRMSSARECFERVVEMAPNDPDALKSLKDAIALDSMHSDGWERVAQTGDTFRKMIRDEEEAKSLEREAKAVKSDKDADALIAEAAARIEAEPENINYYRNLARLYAQKAMFDKALETMRRAQELTPGDPELDAGLARIRVQAFDHEIERLQRAGDREGVETQQRARAQFLFDDLHERVQRYPNDLKLRFELGVMLYENAYYDEAIHQLQRAQRSPSNRVLSLYHLALCFKSKQQYDLARGELEEALQEIPSMNETKKDVLYELGLVSELMGEKDRAADYYKRIYQVDIGYRDIAQKIAAVYGGGGE